MIGADTNVVVRFLTGDDPRQSAAARALFASQSVFLSRSVLLETSWVLESTYRLSPGETVETLLALLGLDNVVVEAVDQVLDALDLAREGMEFADALHVCAVPPGGAFATFDRSLIRSARRSRASVTVQLP